MATGLTVATVCRTAVTGLAAAAFACTLLAPDMSFVALMFLKVALLFQLFWHLPRLVYDAAQLFFQVPPPPGLLFSALVVLDSVAMVLLLAAFSSATGVMVFFRLDNRACAAWTSTPLPGLCSHWNGLAAALTLCAWVFSVVVSLLIFQLRVNADPHH